MSEYKDLFPIFSHNPDLVYLDSAATTQKPRVVIDAVSHFYSHEYATTHRGLYPLAQRATDTVESVRKKIAQFVNAKIAQEIIFTSGTTSAINMLAASIIPKRKKIILTYMEHHSNLVPWQEFAKTHNLELVYIELDGTDLDYVAAEQLIDAETELVVCSHVSNTLGTVVDVKKIASIAKQYESVVVIDGSQALSHIPVDVQDIGCDFYIGTSHKAFGPTGVGFVYGTYELLQQMPPASTGGNMVTTVSTHDAEWSLPPYKFEAGTIPIAQIIGLGAAIDFISTVGFDTICSHTHSLTQYALSQLQSISQVNIISSSIDSGIVTFIVNNIGALDVATLLGEKNIAIRAGHHCTMPLHDSLKLQATCRISMHIYNTQKDIDTCVSALKQIVETLRND